MIIISNASVDIYIYIYSNIYIKLTLISNVLSFEDTYN